VIVGQRTNLVEHVDKLAILRDGTLQLFEPREPSAHSTATIIPLHRAAPQPL
jgi:ABC-type protease/lipase transport system fused ATPase/permease subunit